MKKQMDQSTYRKAMKVLKELRKTIDDAIEVVETQNMNFVGTILPGDPLEEIDGIYLSEEDFKRLAELPAGTKLYAMVQEDV